MTREEFDKLSNAADLAINRILEKGADDVFKPPIFSKSIEATILENHKDEFRKEARTKTINFLKAANLHKESIGAARKSLVPKDQFTFRQVVWLDPFDAVKYLSLAYLLFPKIEERRIPKCDNIVHSHRISDSKDEVFDKNFGYDSFRARSGELSRENVGKWKVVTDISNFFDRIGIHTLENHLKNIGCDMKYIQLVREILLQWAGDRRSFGMPVGADASRILSEAVLLGVDNSLRKEGINFVRYVDDFRIFCESRAEAFKSIEILTELLSDEGLHLNSKKTKIMEILDSRDMDFVVGEPGHGEHEKIDLEERVTAWKSVRVSGRSSISRFYREPGKEALVRIKAIPKADIFDRLRQAGEENFEEILKLSVKFFIYVDRDLNIIELIVSKKITSIFYIIDALIKEEDRFDVAEANNIRDKILSICNWSKIAYPFQLPIVRMTAHPKFRAPDFIFNIIDNHHQLGNKIFFREVISIGCSCFDRARLRSLAKDAYDNVPDFVCRAIYNAVFCSENLGDDEKRPLLKNMKQKNPDWFIARL